MEPQPASEKHLGVALVGCGGIALANHLPGLILCSGARVTGLCDSNEGNLKNAVESTGIKTASTDYNDIVTHDDVDAVIVATPNHTHAPIVMAAIQAGKHVLCEKPLALNLAEASEMYRAAEAAQVRHMTAFTYRFVPGMQYIVNLVQQGFIGTPYHIRVQRFQDWGDRPLGWRQIKALAGTGEVGDMLSHRLDFALMLLGPIQSLVARTRRFIDDRQGTRSELDDWVSVIAEFENGATGVFESTKLATGRGEGGQSRDYCEINGSEGTLVYRLEHPLEVRLSKKGESQLEIKPVPEEFLKLPFSNRDLSQGDPIQTFRYDQDAEFIQAIRENRPCNPSFLEGARVQALIEAIEKSNENRAWVDVKDFSFPS